MTTELVMYLSGGPGQSEYLKAGDRFRVVDVWEGEDGESYACAFIEIELEQEEGKDG